MPRIPCVSFILMDKDKILVEKRKMDKFILPGGVCLPGGHSESTETKEQTLKREMKEELGIEPLSYKYLGEVPLTIGENQYIMSYFLVKEWFGTISANEAESIFWIGLDEIDQIDLYQDKYMLLMMKDLE